MPEPLWKKIDKVESRPVRLELGDPCYYARDYISEGGYSASEANNLISNLKKSRDREGRPEWRHKLTAIGKFAAEVAPALPEQAVIAAIPPSKAKSDPQYDPRLEWVLDKVAELRSDVRVIEPIETGETHTSSHHGGSRRVEDILQTLVWRGFDGSIPEVLWLLDDVITTGGHFKACQRLVRRNHPAVQVAGLFWARTVWPPDFDEFDEFDE